MRFYRVGPPAIAEHVDLTDYCRADPHNVGDAKRCPRCGAFLSMLAWAPPRNAELELWGSSYGDILHGSDLLISERMKSLYEASGMTGLTGFYPVHIVRAIRRCARAPRTSPPPYFMVNAAYSRTVIDQTASEFEWREPPTCTECREGHYILQWKRILFEDGTWPGEDVFHARGLSSPYFVTQRFRDLCDENGILNVVFTPTEEFSYECYPEERRSPKA